MRINDDHQFDGDLCEGWYAFSSEDYAGHRPTGVDRVMVWRGPDGHLWYGDDAKAEKGHRDHGAPVRYNGVFTTPYEALAFRAARERREAEDHLETAVELEALMEEYET